MISSPTVAACPSLSIRASTSNSGNLQRSHRVRARSSRGVGQFDYPLSCCHSCHHSCRHCPRRQSTRTRAGLTAGTCTPRRHCTPRRLYQLPSHVLQAMPLSDPIATRQTVDIRTYLKPVTIASNIPKSEGRSGLPHVTEAPSPEFLGRVRDNELEEFLEEGKFRRVLQAVRGSPYSPANTSIAPNSSIPDYVNHHDIHPHT
jgi:hypothetical protein